MADINGYLGGVTAPPMASSYSSGAPSSLSASKGGSFAGATSPKRGKGVLNAPNAARVPLCAHCNGQIRYLKINKKN